MIDDHCHPFALHGGPLDLAALSLDVEEDPDAQQRRGALAAGRMAIELMSVRLAERLGCEPEEVSQARAEASADWGSYVAGLFADAGLTALVMDTATPTGSQGRLEDYAALTRCQAFWLQRLDPSIDRLIGQGASAREVVHGVEVLMAGAAARGCVGFKSIAAYRTGLAVDPDITEEAADRSLAADVPVRRRGKACRDLALRRAMAAASDLGLPIQIHTGFGDSELRLAESNPLLLEDLLRTPEGSSARVVLIHGAYPWHEELAFLAATKPNVWAEVSLFNIFSPVTVGDRLLRVLDLAPAGRVLLGTDGHREPETYWFAATLLRQAWGHVRARAAGAGARGAWLDTVERLLFEENARDVYGI